MALPLNDDKVLIFVAWLLSRGLQSLTISTHLSGLRQVKAYNYTCTLQPNQVKQKLTIVNKGLWLTIVNKGSWLTIINKGSWLTIINEGL